jgi:citrate synthase
MTETVPTDTASIKIGDQTASLPIIHATDGHPAIDISKLGAQLGYNTFDQGFVNTASTRSAITYIDGDNGILRYRGYPIEELAGKKSFTEVAHLLIFGELPNGTELQNFEDDLRSHTLIHEDLKNLFHSMPQNAHPMSVLSAGVSALSTFYQDSLNVHDEAQVQLSTIRLLAKFPVLTAYAHKNSAGQALLYPDNSLSYVENFLRLSFGTMAEPYEQNPVVTKALDTLFTLHADHEQNASTSTVRLVGSTQANLFASVSAGINALFGPLHGGANEAVIEMLKYIQASGETVQQYIARVKNKEDGMKLMGFGHRVYKSFDPRAKIVKAHADSVLHDLGIDDPLIDIAKQLEEAALNDQYFIERKLYPNVDFYSGIIYKALGFPAHMFTPLFALGRLPGWIAHWREMMTDSHTKIGRPQQVYIGPGLRHVQ